VKLGAYYWGIWSFVLLLINYFQVFNLGIYNAANILLVQNRNNLTRFKDTIANSLFCIGTLIVGIVLVGFIYFFFDIKIMKYEIGNLFYYICGIAILLQINQFCMTVYRVKNRLLEVAFYQSIIPILIFLALFLETGKELIQLFVYVYLIGHIISLIIFISKKKIQWNGNISRADIVTIFVKGGYLFIYNICFYLIIISTRTIVCYYYTVDEFGYFAFCYTLANAIIVLLESFSFVVFPKIIDRFSAENKEKCWHAIDVVRVNYVAMSHGLIYVGLLAFPYLLELLPEYKSALQTLNLIALSILMYINTFGYNSLLMAQGKERKLASISFLCLTINILIAFFLVKVLYVSYGFVIIATLIAYFIYSYGCTCHGLILLEKNNSFKKVIYELFPMNLLIPYIIALIFTFLNIGYLQFIPLLVYFIMNKTNILKMSKTVKNVVVNPNMINI
jgi:O-antigen/teichoic acid export membrane protein